MVFGIWDMSTCRAGRTSLSELISRLTLASNFTLATAVNEATLLLPVLLGLPLWAFCRTHEGLEVAGSSGFAESALLPFCCWWQHCVISWSSFLGCRPVVWVSIPVPISVPVVVAIPITVALSQDKGGLYGSEYNKESHQKTRISPLHLHVYHATKILSFMSLLQLNISGILQEWRREMEKGRGQRQIL